METKHSLINYTYKQLSRYNKGWKHVFIAEKPWREIAVDVDSLVFFYMRNYTNIPYKSRKDKRMVVAAFLNNPKQSVQRVINDMTKYCTNQIGRLLTYLKSIAITLHPVCSTGYPKLKREIREERLGMRNTMEREFAHMDISNLEQVLSHMKKYILLFRDEVRDIVVAKFTDIYHCTEADKWCGKNHRVIMSEDVDIFLFGTKKTIIVKPFVMNNIPTRFRFLDCKSYYMDKGISDYNAFIQVAFMMGTDYNYGIKGMGEKRSVNAINKYNTVSRFVAVKYDITDENVDKLMTRYKKFMEYIS